MEKRSGAWGQVNVNEKRVEFVIRASRGRERMAALCREFSISRQTGYKWLRRYRGCDDIGELGEQSRRPRRSPHKTAPEIEQRVVELRRAQPDWGAPLLAWVLEEEEGVKIPWITVHRILKRQGLVREEAVRPATQRFERAEPNELWQMDFKGMAASRPGCLPLSLLDDHSRYVVGLWALESTGGAGVRQVLEQRFREVGLPQGLLMDHGTPWWTPGSRIGLTVLTVWLLKLGIGLHFSGFRHPQTQGKVERWHGSLERAMRGRGFPAAFEQQRCWLERFRREYNERRPHRALGMQPPVRFWRPSERSYPAKIREWEYPAGVCLERLNSQGMLSWQGRRWFVCEALANELVRVEELDGRLLVWFCQKLVCEIDRRAGHTTAVVWPASPGSTTPRHREKCQPCTDNDLSTQN
jgi:transposase InsO family protein